MSVELSIIVPVYNAEKYLQACLDSILASTYKNYEILLIDDGSTDGSGEICEHYQRKYSAIHTFHTKNCGLPAARNLGLNQAVGSLIGFVDADDQIAPDMFEELVCAMVSDVQMTACEFLRCPRESAVILSKNSSPPRTEDRCGIAKQILHGKIGPYVWNKLYRKEILDSNNIRFIQDSQGCEDLFFNMTYLNYCNHAVFLNRQMYLYITTDNSIMTSFRNKRIVADYFVSIPRANRYAAETLEPISADLALFASSRAAMFYQTVLRKLRHPNEAYIQESISYVRQHKRNLLRYSWGWKYYLSALVLCIDYRLWAKIFRKTL